MRGDEGHLLDMLIWARRAADPLIVFRAATEDCPRLIRQLESLLPDARTDSG